MDKPRLVDANALKETMKKRIVSTNHNAITLNREQRANNDAILECIDEIDNAPTIKVPENTVNCILTMFGKCSYNKTGCSDCEIKDKIRKALNERPQGKWIFRQGVTCGGYYKCNKCGEVEREEKNYCPKCGVRMGGKEE